jgi:hypothetical protein
MLPWSADLAVYVIQGYNGHVAMWRNRTAFRQPFPEAADAMFGLFDATHSAIDYRYPLSLAGLCRRMAD